MINSMMRECVESVVLKVVVVGLLYSTISGRGTVVCQVIHGLLLSQPITIPTTLIIAITTTIDVVISRHKKRRRPCERGRGCECACGCG